MRPEGDVLYIPRRGALNHDGKAIATGERINEMVNIRGNRIPR